jgi:hypothetical protein
MKTCHQRHDAWHAQAYAHRREFDRTYLLRYGSVVSYPTLSAGSSWM